MTKEEAIEKARVKFPETDELLLKKELISIETMKVRSWYVNALMEGYNAGFESGVRAAAEAARIEVEDQWDRITLVTSVSIDENERGDSYKISKQSILSLLDKK